MKLSVILSLAAMASTANAFAFVNKASVKSLTALNEKINSKVKLDNITLNLYHFKICKT